MEVKQKPLKIMFIIIGLMVSLVSFPIFYNHLKEKYIDEKSSVPSTEKIVTQALTLPKPLRLDKSQVNGTTQTTGDITKEQLYEEVNSLLSRGDALSNSDSIRQAVDYFQRAFEKGKNSSLENICRSRLVVAYERINEDTLALEHAEWLLNHTEKESPLYQQYSEMKSYLQRKALYKKYSPPSV